ncbi:hypothetical protein BRARA_G00914 [Brassica rapa]|uniref:Uncharacterized protein n=1 Tax=Brassica campestris TaxID=3711 RepID=A0A397YL72_BRACM|nr:hypothetical protein BRARA_G00914 [Brassica rapa]
MTSPLICTGVNSGIQTFLEELHQCWNNHSSFLGILMVGLQVQGECKDHQAIIPEWEGCLNVNLGSSATTKLSGTCVVPMPALNMPENIDDIVGKGREFCVCRDRGSIRCVRQHVKEAREEVVKILGFEKLGDMGFCYMGDEVVRSWSDEDALSFHEVVYSNPVTLAAFFSPTNHEIVSFYFNGFVLRRRATQNRWFMLDIDSDDDEWHEGYGAPLGTQYVEEKEDFAMESPLHHQGIDKFNEEVHQLYHQEDASISDNDEDDNIDTREDGYKMNNKYVDKFSRCNEERLNVEDESCTPFELAHDAVISS